MPFEHNRIIHVSHLIESRNQSLDKFDLFPIVCRCLKDDIQDISRENEDVDENNETVESLCTYPDFTVSNREIPSLSDIQLSV